MSTLPIEIINKIYIYYWSNIYINNVLSELKNIINTSLNLNTFYNKIMINYDKEIKENYFEEIIYYNDFIKKYSNKNSNYKCNNSVFKIITKSNYWPKYIKLLSDMYCSDLIYFSLYCLNNSGHMRFYMQHKLNKINDKFLMYKIKMLNLHI